MTTLELLKARLCLPLLVLTLLGWGLFLWQQSQPASEPTERIVNKTQFVDRVVDRVVEKKIVKPDGTTIQTIERSNSKTFKAEAVTDTTALTPKLKNSFGVKAELPTSFDLRPPKHYRFEFGRRIGQTNTWWTTSLTTSDKLQPQAVTVGLRLDF